MEMGARTNVCRREKGWRGRRKLLAQGEIGCFWGVMTDRQIGNIRKEKDVGRE